MSLFPCAHAARHQTLKRMPRPLVQGSVLPLGLRLFCATSSLTSTRHASGQAPEMPALRLLIRRHPTTTSHVFWLRLKDGEAIVQSAKCTATIHPPVRPTLGCRHPLQEGASTAKAPPDMSNGKSRLLGKAAATSCTAPATSTTPRHLLCCPLPTVRIERKLRRVPANVGLCLHASSIWRRVIFESHTCVVGT